LLGNASTKALNRDCGVFQFSSGTHGIKECIRQKELGKKEKIVSVSMGYKFSQHQMMKDHARAIQ